MRSLRTAAILALGLAAAPVARAQADNDEFFAFDGTARQQMVLQAGLTNAQVYGAVAAVERVLMPMGTFDQTRMGGEFNWIWGVAQVPGCFGDNCRSGVYKLQTIDLTASNFAASYCSGKPGQDGGTRVCGFYAAAMTTTLASREGERFTDNLLWGMAGRGFGPVAPLMLGLGGSEYRRGMTSVRTSVVLGVNVTSPWLSGRVGYLGAPGDRGVYTDLSVDKIRAFLTTAVMEELQDVSMLAAGVRKLGADAQQAPAMVSAYVRSLRQLPPQNLSPSNDYQLPDVDDQVGAFRHISAHLKPEDILQLVDVDAAYLIQPVPQLYNLIGSLHTPGFHPRGDGVRSKDGSGGIAIGGGLVNLPELPAFGLRKSRNVNFHIEALGAMGDAFEGRMRFHINDPEYLVSFPFARNSWSFYYYLSVGEALLVK